ncbi:alpha-2-macroglobulin isoform X2 [Spea bombifrons]|uniref:alpha-2-macroglobulin isoform X2 n=1 Tax=Spea bombifrons TaxID=233779 RepID=UPI00234ACD92|nr:alpha-2-macroglobulin isoform X2 [Spea bombifrons]
MWRSALALCLLLSALSGGAAADPGPQYMLLVPSLLHAQSPERFGLLLSHLNESISVSVTLELATRNVTLLEKDVTEPDDDSWVTFVTPSVDAAEVGFLTLRADGGTLHFRSRRSVLIKPLLNLVFIQTDKPIYKPGQKVLFRIAALSENFHAVSEHFPVVYIEDPRGNRITQWLDVETCRGIVQESFQLTSEPSQGTYKVVAVRAKGPRVQHSFTVEEYVLPKYEVQVKVPPVLTILDKELRVTVCGKYTYGKPVSGQIKVRVCRKFAHSYTYCQGEEDAVCEELLHQAGPDGCFSDVMPTKIFQMKRTGYEMKITAKATITEDGTDAELTAEASSEVKTTLAKVSFQNVESHFKRGIPLYGQVLLEDASGSPIGNQTVVVFVGHSGKNYSYTTKPDGTADFSIDTSSFQESSLQLRAFYKSSEYCGRHGWLNPTYEEPSRGVSRFYSKSASFLKVKPIFKKLRCQSAQRILVHYVLTAEGIGHTKDAVFRYVIMSKGGIVSSGKHAVLLVQNQEALGEFSFKLDVGANVAPLAKILVFLILDSGEVIADTATLNVDRCFDNKVKLSFSPTESLPGSQTVLSLHTDPDSFCAVRGVDSSVLIMKPEAELSAKSIYELLPVVELFGYNHDGHYLEEPRDDPCVRADPIFINGLHYNPSSPAQDTDTYAIFKELGLKVSTNTNIRSPTLCLQFEPYGMPAGIARMSALEDMMMPEAIALTLEAIGIETVRKYFPETLLFDLIATDSHGNAEVPLTFPDSITTWKVGMFCTSEESGFGLSDTVSLVAFQPFFLDLTLPYSGIRGEKFTLKASVFNYLPQTIRVSVSLEESDEYIAKPAIEKQDGYCIDPNGKITLSWEVALKSLGEVNFTVSAETLEGGLCGNEVPQPTQRRKDTITKHVLVEPEGVEKEETQNAMVCGKGPETSETFSLKLPELVVEGSARGYFSVIGDVMGNAMQNLGSLLKMPFGCGEQNMVLFTPNIYILEYLNNTHQLTPELKSKALSYLNNGYQRQLTYRHYDGSYSAFGPSHGEGNTWLTAFVMRSFARARSHIYIEEKQITDALLWLTHRQKDNGCFLSVGQLFHIDMKGGVGDETTLAAYITIALLEYPLPLTHPVLRNALFCLETAAIADNNIYTQALMAYAFTLAGKTDARTRLLETLKEKAIEKDGTVHWHRPEFSGTSRAPNRRAPSVEVEMTSYVLLAILSSPRPSDEDITYATKVINWLIKQQNPTGGFSSTQDTVMGLQALSLYGSLTQSHDSPRTVSLALDASPIAKLHVEDSNRLLLQSVPLDKVPADYTATITGSGCVYLQTTLRYNVPHPKEDAPFSISVTPQPPTCDSKSLKSFSVAVNVSYTGKREKTNMAIVDIKLPSGYIPIKPTVRELTNVPLIKRTDILPNKVIVYFDSLTKDIKSFRFSLEQDIPVRNLQPATAMIYDYYETDEFAVTEYSAPCSSEDETNNA